MKPAKGGAAPLIAALALAAAVPFAQNGVDARLGRYRSQKEIVFMWSGQQIKRAAPGFENLLADVYWLRTVQYFGIQRVYAKDRDFRLLKPLIDVTVTLDPRLIIAYRYGSIFLAEPAPVGAGNPRAAVELLEQGAKANPLNWELRKELGYFHFLFLHDSHTAAKVLQEASTLPGAAWWLQTMAADFLARGGDLQNSRAVWTQLYNDSEGQMRANALTHLKLIDTEETRDRLQEFVAAFKASTGRYPTDLAELVKRGVIIKVPVDPAGQSFVYDSMNGNVSVDPSSPFWRPDL